MAEIIKSAPKEALNTFSKSAKKLSANYGKTTTEISCLTHAITEIGNRDELDDFISLDGDVFFEFELDNIIADPKQDQQQAETVKKDLKALIKATNLTLESDKKIQPVSPFYAVLMMDGDSLGSQMSDHHKSEAISKSLNSFTKGVAKVVEKQSGFLVYAGGDDVLALLPLEQALKCANDLRLHYLESFEKEGEYTKKDKSKGQVKSTLSGAIEYVHIKTPLGKVLADAHHLLDQVAKDEYGRDSIAVRVWKPGGQHLQWAMPWKHAVENGKVKLDDLADEFRKTEQETPFSSSFFFNIEARFAMLQSKNAQGELQLAKDFDEKIITQLIAVEYLSSGVNNNRKPKLTLDKAKQDIAPLIKQCLPIKRTFENEQASYKSMNKLTIDAAHLLRFLANKGVDRG
jgi:CRISPR-associated protein Cmr2